MLMQRPVSVCLCVCVSVCLCVCARVCVRMRACGRLEMLIQRRAFVTYILVVYPLAICLGIWEVLLSRRARQRQAMRLASRGWEALGEGECRGRERGGGRERDRLGEGGREEKGGSSGIGALDDESPATARGGGGDEEGAGRRAVLYALSSAMPGANFVMVVKALTGATLRPQP